MIFCILGVNVSRSQESSTEIHVDFKVNTTVIDYTYSDNAKQVQEIVEYLRHIRQDTTINIVEISFCGAASPEGSYQLNRKLANGRLAALEKIVRSEVDIPDSIITRNDSYIPWEYLKSQVENLEFDYKDEVVAILNEEARLVDYHRPNTHIDNRVVKIRQLDNGKVWQMIHRKFFASMRNAYVVFVTEKRELPRLPEPKISPDTIKPLPEDSIVIPGIVTDTIAVAEQAVSAEELWSHRLHIKTNALGLGLAIANAGVEIDLAKHWSIAVPVYYSAWNYFVNTVKFRTLAVQPEVRYWLSESNDGFFAGAHFGMAYFNLAVGGQYRYQDHDGTSPALGGGVSVGYRLPISKDNKWNIEFVVGGGVYSLNYDTFYNIENGKLATTHQKTYWGVDNAAINISYCFDLK